ncbi:hypothetical protein N9M16_08725 [Candidatus Dependentiae bacterium]|nr:hypothetical protein [Candidatus Dependentiae bacterium]
MPPAARWELISYPEGGGGATGHRLTSRGREVRPTSPVPRHIPRISRAFASLDPTSPPPSHLPTARRSRRAGSSPGPSQSARRPGSRGRRRRRTRGDAEVSQERRPKHASRDDDHIGG